MHNRTSRWFAAGACAVALAACTENTPRTATPAGSITGATTPPSAGAPATGAMAGRPAVPAAGASALPAAGASALPAAGSGAVTPGPVVPMQSSAAATIAPFGMGSMLTGTANFTQTGADVAVNITLTNCPDGEHPVHVHAGTACTDMMTQMGHWGGDGPPQTRGEGIPTIMCMGGTGTTTHMRVASASPALAWSLGGAAESNLLNHVIVVHNPDKSRIGCGQIK